MSLPPEDGTKRMRRALLTDGEREAVIDGEMDQNARSTHLARIKNKLDRLGEDMRLLREHEPAIYEQARKQVCEEELDERVQRLEEEVEELRAQLEREE